VPPPPALAGSAAAPWHGSRSRSCCTSLIQHDLYDAGQIGLRKKLLASANR
jgi:hypothetical protein